MPATAKLYVSLVPKPEGALKRETDADLRAFTNTTDPLRSLLGQLAATSGASYAREVSPWLGREAGLFSSALTPVEGLGEAALASIASGGAPTSVLRPGTGPLALKVLPVAAILSATSTAKAKAFLDALARRDHAHESSCDGVSCETSASGLTDAIVGNFAVIGSESAVKEVIAARKGGDSLLRDSSAYAKLSGKAPSQTLLSAYIDTAGETVASGKPSSKAEARSREATSSSGQGSSPTFSSVLELLSGGAQQMELSVIPESGSISADLDALNGSSEAARQRAAKSAANLLATLPEGSWLAAAAPEVGAHLTNVLSLLRALSPLAGSALSSFGGPALEQLLRRLIANPTALQSVFSGWAGSGALFASGSGLLELEGGIVIESEDEARSVGAVSELGAALATAGASVHPANVEGASSAVTVALPHFPLTLAIGAGSGRFVIGLGTASVTAGLKASGQTMSSSALYREAERSLGGSAAPAVVFSVPSLSALLEATGLSSSASLHGLMPRLHAVRLASAAEQSLGAGITRMRLSLLLEHAVTSSG